MQKAWRLALVGICSTLLILTLGPGCPTFQPVNTNDETNTTDNNNTDDNNNTNDNNNTTDNNNTNDNINNNNNNNNAGGLTVVKTGIAMHCQDGLRVSDDLIVYGTTPVTGIDYIKPGDTAGRGIPGGDTYSSTDFAVAKTKIALVNNFQVTIYDTTAATTNTIPAADIRLGAVGSGNVVGSGDYFAAKCDPNEVTDGKLVKAIDVTGASPVVISFDVNPIDYFNGLGRIAVDGKNVYVSTTEGKFFKYTVDQPTALPEQFDVSGQGGINGATEWVVSAGVIFYRDDDGYPNARLLDTTAASPASVKMTENPAGGALALKAGKFAYFADRTSDDENGLHLRSAIGTVPGPGATLAGDTQIDGSTNNNNFLGWGQTNAVTGTGSYTFIAGWEALGQGEYLQVSTGGAFQIVPDPTNTSEYGVPASDVVASSKIVAFKTGASSTAACDTVVGYIALP
jgi:hypothetical protein